jgi:DNA adenine methylase
MKYMGSKRRIAKHILPIMLAECERYGITTWVEPFVGGGNMIDKVPATFMRIGYDINPHVISSMIGIRDHVSDLPASLSKEEYSKLKGLPPDCITSWLRFTCSFGGKFDNGYASEKESDDSTFCGYGVRNALKQSPLIQGADFTCGSYEVLDFENALIYCDPPYQGTTAYKTEDFNHEKFFDWCREQAKNNIVFVSEYNAPDDFECVWSGTVKTNFASSRTAATHNAVEKLFKVGVV